MASIKILKREKFVSYCLSSILFSPFSPKMKKGLIFKQRLSSLLSKEIGLKESCMLQPKNGNPFLFPFSFRRRDPN